jgi:hypothetical protein
VPTPSATVTASTDEDRDVLFARFIPVTLEDILTSWGPVPAVVRSSNQSGPWDVVGSSRTVHLKDGSTAREAVTECRTPAYFAYTVKDFTNPVKFLASEARGQWWFDARPGGGTDVRWTYAFIPHNAVAAAVLQPIVAHAWRRFMREGLERLLAQAR